jgi:integrase
VVLFMAYTGVRWGEMAALKVKRIDLLHRRAAIAESVTLVRGIHTWSTPKNHIGRGAPIPRAIADDLALHLAGRGPEDLVFPGVNTGKPMRSKVFHEACFTAAADHLGLVGLVPHGLRHTAASMAIASGADVKVVQQMLGHKSATMTLDQYGHLFPDRLDDIASALDELITTARRAADKEPTRSERTMILPFRARQTNEPPRNWGL